MSFWGGQAQAVVKVQAASIHETWIRLAISREDSDSPIIVLDGLILVGRTHCIIHDVYQNARLRGDKSDRKFMT